MESEAGQAALHQEMYFTIWIVFVMEHARPAVSKEKVILQ
jgi:hypothetical protein